MTSFQWIFVLLPIAVAVGFALIVGLVLVVGRRRPQQHTGWVATADGGVRTWNGEVLGDGFIGALGGSLASTFGTFRLERGVLAFRPDDASLPGWSAECRHLAVARRGMVELDGADVLVRGPMGEVRCNVSDERINRASRNTLKTMRQRGYAQEFVDILVGHGARPV